jgi:hypothetical protein
MGGKRMIHVDDGKVNLSGTSGEMLMDGIMAVKAISDTNELLQTEEAKERYLKDIREMMYKDVKTIKFGCVFKEASKTGNESEKTKLQKRRKFINGNNEDRS